MGGKLEGDSGSGSKLEGDSDSKLEGVLLLGTRCHSINTACENMKLFHVCPLGVTHCGGANLKVTLAGNLSSFEWALTKHIDKAICPPILDLKFQMGGKLEGDFGCKLKGDFGSKCEGDSGSKLEGDFGSKLEGDFGSKLEGDSGSKLEQC